MRITEKQIADLKKKHGELFQISVDGKSCIIRRPNRKDLSFVSVVKDPIKMSETLLKQLWVDGDMEIQTDDTFFFSSHPQNGRSS